MINKIFRKLTHRSILANFKQFLSVILIVLLCTMLLSGFITNSTMLNRSISSYFEDTNLADLWLYVDKIDSNDEQYFNDLKSNGIISDYNKRLYLETSVRFEEKQIQNNTKIYVGNGKISNPYIESGRIEKGYGCLIDKHVAEDRKIKIGEDKLNFSIDYPIFGKSITLDFEFVVTGTMSLDECADTYSSWALYFDETYFLNGLNSCIQKLADSPEYSALLQILGIDKSELLQTKVPYNQVLLKTKDTGLVIENVKEYYNSSLNKLNLVLDRNQIESVMLLSSEITQSKKMIYVFPLIFLVVSILVILTTIDQLVLQEKTKIGTLKSIGIPDKKILRHYSKFGAVLCLIGSTIGIILGVIIIPKIMFIKYNLVYSLPEDYIKLSIPFWWLILVLVGMICLGYLVSLLVCHNILHKKPIECLRRDINLNVKFKSKNKKNKLPLPVKMALRNVRLKPVRTVMATIGIAGCVALLLCGFGVKDTLNYSLNNDFGNVLKYDITTTYSSDDFLEKIKGLDGFEYYEKSNKYYSEISNGEKRKSVSLYEIDAHSSLSDIYLEKGETCLSKAIADELNVKVGDNINVVIGNITLKYTINLIIPTSAINGIFIADDILPMVSNINVSKGVWIKCSNPDAEAVKFVNSINGTDGAYSMQTMQETVFQKVSSIDLMTATLKTFAIALAIVVLLNLIFLVISERIKEIATLKVLGTNHFSITLTIFFEILFMSIIGTIIGMCLGYPLLVLVLKINKVEIINYLYHLNVLSFVYSTLIIFATIFIVTVFCHFKVKKVNMIESLKSVE